MHTGYYPAILRVEHPAASYIKVQGGSAEVDAKPHELRFFDKMKGGSRYVLHKAT